jgi:hypothetical protein
MAIDVRYILKCDNCGDQLHIVEQVTTVDRARLIAYQFNGWTFNGTNDFCIRCQPRQAA